MESLKNPTVYSIPNAINLDASLAAVQSELSSVPWLEKIFPRARTVNTATKGKPNDLIPMVYQANKEYYPAQPNDALTAQSFFRVWNGQRIDNYQPTRTGDFTRTEIDLIVSGHLDRINKNVPYYYTELLINDVLAAIRLNPNIEVTEIHDERPEDIWRGYTVNESQLHLLQHPYFAFRVTFIFRYRMQCYNISSQLEGTGIFDETFDETFE